MTEEVKKCRSCEREIVWTRTSNDKKMPVDATAVTTGSFGIGPHPDGDGLLSVFRTKVKEQWPDYDGLFYSSHFATCPDAAEHRK